MATLIRSAKRKYFSDSILLQVQIQTALIKLIDQWKECIDKGDIVGTLFIDVRKAFDVVDDTSQHNIKKIKNL